MSIKKQLTSLIISTVILATFFAALQGYRNSLNQLDTVFDQELLSVANFLSSMTGKESTFPSSIDSNIVFQLIQDEQVISASQNAPKDPIRVNKNTFGEATFFGQRWRTYATESDYALVIVAQPLNLRSNSAEEILLVTLQPIILAIPLIAILIYYIIQKSLGALTFLSTQLRQKSADDLSEIDVPSPPEELKPVIHRLNSLFSRLDQAFEREKQISANAAHELRTPMSVLSLTAHNIEQEFNAGNLTGELIDELKANIERQAHVIEQMIALYRFAPEQFQQKLKPVDLALLLQEIIAQNFHQIDANSQTISLEGQDATVMGEYFALFTLFENIIKNSIKYSGIGSRILVSLASDEADNEKYVDICIEDSGQGLKDEVLNKIFERFYRIDSEQSRVKGSGLGLSIAKHIVSLHKGEIRCSKSALGGLKTCIRFSAHGDIDEVSR
uniref:sensor histidine kinase n=1 Tax=Ningiella ruwaisensis TaxID=2364274 RepID=UPI00109F67CF|nr:ATP-binding protein [Ningiella ruwaisensis]